jgi:hypothetical protein
MRNLLTVILCSGVFFTQQAIASSQCTLKPGPDIHCSGCTTLEHFAFFGASALYSAGQQRSIQVIGDNGSNVYVSKGTYWERADIRIELGFLGTWGAENVPYPSLTYAKVYARDTANKIGGTLPNNGRMLYGALKAKCKEIETEQRKKAIEELQKSLRFHFGGLGGGGLSHGFNLPNNFQIPTWGFSGLGGDNRIPIVTVHEMRPCTSQPGDGSTC